MTKFVGRQQEVGIARESSRGVAVAPSFWLPKVTFSLEDKAEHVEFNGNYGVLAGGDEALVASQWSEGDLELEVGDKSVGLLLYALFGTLTSGAFNSVYKHTLALQNSVQPTTLTMMMNDPIGGAETPTKSLAYRLSMINSLELTSNLGELVKAKFNVIAKKHMDYTRQASSYTAENKFGHHHVKVFVASAEAGLDAATRLNIRSLKLNIERGVERENSLGTVQPVDIVAKMFKISGSIVLTYEDRTYRDYLLAGTKRALRIAINRSDVTIGATTPQIQFDLPYVHFHEWEPSSGLDEIGTQEIQFTALYDVANSKLVGANTFVVNGQASY